MSILKELLALNEAKAGFKLYTEHPYGHGFMKTPVTKGEMLPTEDGDEMEFVGISADGSKVIVKYEGEQQEVEPSRVEGKILPAGQKPDGEGFEKGHTDPKQWT